MRKVYTTPRLIVHGKVEELTQARKRIGYGDGRRGLQRWRPGKESRRSDGMGGRRHRGYS
jgi:hypothetical protein